MEVRMPLLALLLLAGAARPHEPSAESWRAGLEQAEGLLRAERFEAARELFRGLVEQHERRPWVWHELPRLIEGLRRASFWASYTPPALQTLVSGELVAYSPSGGNLTVRYTPESLADFLETKSGRRVHPAAFAGPYTVEIKGQRLALDSGEPTLFVGIGTENEYAITLSPQRTLGREGDESASVRVSSARGTLVHKDVAAVAFGRPFVFKVRLEHAAIQVHLGGQRILSLKKPAEVFGRVGFEGFAEFERLELQGKAQTSWLHGARDAAVLAARTEFEQSWSPARELPEWIRLEEDGAFLPLRIESRELPGSGRAGEERMLAEILAGADAERVLASQSTSAAFAAWAAAVAAYRGQRHDAALAAVERVCALDRDFRPARRLRAELLAQAGKLDDASAALRILVAEDPDDSRAWARLALLQLVRGRRADVRATIEQAVAAAAYASGLYQVHLTLEKSIGGPDWRARHELETGGYHVLSDMDLRTCKEVALVLESSLARFRSLLPGARAAAAEPFRVYVFSGRAGYLDYARGTLGISPESSAGLYSPALRQLLVWNVPDKGDLLRTVRHEGLHQYLDSVMEAPVWLSEGLAEYFEMADFTRRASAEIPVRRDHVELLRGALARWRPLFELVELDDDAFYADSDLHYAQAWASVYFLRHSTPEHRAAFERLLELLAARVPAPDAVRASLGEDLHALDYELRRFVLALEP
jgi:hypothetical protein